MIALQEALDIVLAHSTAFGTETIALEQALNRVLAQPVLADRNYPPFNRASMDGYAIKKADWDQGIRSFDIVGQLLAGGDFDTSKIRERSALKIMTGAATPLAYDAIVRIEDCEATSDKVSFTITDLSSFQNIAKEGEDIQKGEIVLDAYQQISLGSLTALASIGAATVHVLALPKVCIITTGDEVIPIEKMPKYNQIRNSNALSLKVALHKLGIADIIHTHVNDHIDDLERQLHQAIQSADIILFTGGVSAGSADFVPQVLANAGFEKLFHKVKIKPGKPAWFGVHPTTAKVVFALPGNPLSVLTTFKTLVEPFILKCIGKSPINYSWKQLAIHRTQRVALDEFFPYLVTISRSAALVEPLRLNGSGDVTATLQASGLALHPIDQEQLAAGSFIKVFEF